MVSASRVQIVRLVTLLIRWLDSVLEVLGIKIFKVNLKNTLHGLPAHVQHEARDPDIVVPMGLFFKGMEQDRRMDLLSRLQQMQILRFILTVRGGAKKALQENPDVLKTPIIKPVFIVGFPRTGTTLLFNLMWQDPQLRAPYFWEIVRPFPPGRPDDWRNCERYRIAERLLELKTTLSRDNWDVAHEMRADLPEECYFMFGRSFYQYHYFLRLETLYELESWLFGLTNEELVHIYAYYKKHLQLIGYQGMKDKTYLLKSHMHLLSLEALLEVFPDARFIFTYRRLSEIVPSFCSMVEMGTSNWGPRDNQFGRRTLRLLSEMANRSVRFFQKYDYLPEQQRPVIDIDYTSFVDDPIQGIRTIYKHFGFRLTEEVEQNMRDYLKNNPKHKHGRHTYNLTDYNITEDDLRVHFRPYLEYFQSKSDNLI